MSNMEMLDIGLDGIGHAISDNKFKIPLYQRSYAWEEKHVKELLQDLGDAIREGQNQYFLGSVVLSKEDANALEIIDGQQRITTLTIFLAAIRDYFEVKEDSERAKIIEEQYLFKKDSRTLDILPRVTLNNIDHAFFVDNVLENAAERQGIEPTKESHQKILMAKEEAKSQVEAIAKVGSKDTDSLLDWVDYIDKKTKVIWFEVPNQANAYMIFETLNDRGLDLSTIDLLKNYLFSLSDDRIGEVRDCWTIDDK